MDYVRQDVICPHCGKEIPFDAFADVVDTNYDACEGHFWEICACVCENCGEEFSAQIQYTLKFEKILD